MQTINQIINDSLVSLPSGLLVNETVARDYIKIHRRPKCIDLFAGAGGMSLGVIQAGFEVIAAVDNSATCAMTFMCNLGSYPCQFHFIEPSDEEEFEKNLTYEMNRNKDKFSVPLVAGSGWISHEPDDVPGVGHFFLGDIRKMTGQDILGPLGLNPGDVDLVCGEPPCQGFSTAGKRNVMDPLNSLVFEFARMVLEIHPRYIVMEEVPGIMTMTTPEGLPVVDVLCRILEEGDFGIRKSLIKCIESQTGVVLMRSKTKPKLKKRKKAKKKVIA